MTVKQIKEDTVVMDMNHPMAGKTLVFDVKVLDIHPAPPPPSAEPAKQAPSKPAPSASPGKPTDPAKK
jgi:FKBP-type peptidyl-prolyl cis-trans isomerase 2